MAIYTVIFISPHKCRDSPLTVLLLFKNPDYQMMPSDLEAWEEKHGKIPDDVILLIFFDWGKHYANKKKYLGTDTNNASLLHFPGAVEGVWGLSLSYCYSCKRHLLHP